MMCCALWVSENVFFWKELLSTLAQFWRTDENNKHQQRYFTLFHVVPSEGGAERPLNSWPCYIFNLLIPAICDAHTRVLKCKMQGLGYGNTVFWQGLGAFPWPCYIFDLLILAICDAHARVLKSKMQGLGYGNTVFWQGLGAFPWPCYIFDLLIPAICDAHTRVLKCKMQGL